MKRDLAQLSQHVYDVLIIGGGIYGVWVAWDAALRGLSVALLEKGDFGHATSSNSLRIVHGGLRYLQHGDIRRVRQSISERKALMRVAPHLVHPLPFLIPTYGHGMRGKGVLSLALVLNDLIGFDRNRGQDPQKYIPRGRIISKDECLRLLPGVERDGLTGGAIFYDGQVANAERLILSVARSAAMAGAHMANYVEVTGLLAVKGRLAGVRATDVLTGEKLDIQASTVVNATGPWLDQVLDLLGGRHPRRKLMLSKTFNLLVKRQLFPHCAVGVYSKRRFDDRDVSISKGSRLFFITPWHSLSLIGTAHLPWDADLDHFKVTEAEVQAFLDDINAAYPAADLQRRDVCFAPGGLLPVAGYAAGDVRLIKRPQILDHCTEGGLEGLISVIGVKFTEARRVAEGGVNLVFRKLGRAPSKSTTAMTPVHGGRMEQFSAFVDREMRKTCKGLSAEAICYLIWRYGAEYPRVLRYLHAQPASPPAISGTSVLQTSPSPPRGEDGARDLPRYEDGSQIHKALESLLEAEVRHGVREEMAHKLADMVFRRTTLGIAGDPGDTRLRACAAIMAQELGWGASRTDREVEEVRTAFSTRSSTS
jgi:glycerol-3-phosphate dehydrogenase